MKTSDEFVPRQQLRSFVSNRIRQAILTGEYKPGEWLRQQRIAEDLGVSQMPVREALKELVADGLVEHIPYRGARVVQISVEDVADLYRHRAFLESWAAGLAAVHITDDELTRLQQIHEQIAANQSPEQITEYRRLNREFHELIYRASRRAYLIRILDQVWSAFPTMLWGNFAQTAVSPLPARDATDLQEHAAILAALQSGDSAGAAHFMKQHIAQAGEALTAVAGPRDARNQSK